MKISIDSNQEFLNTHLKHTLVAGLICLTLPWLCGADEYRLARGIYSSRSANDIGDLLTVIVNESTSSSKSEDMSSSKNMQAGMSPAVFGESQSNDSELIANGAVKVPGYGIESSSSYNGAGERNTSETFTAQFTVRVVDRHPNNVLVIRGERKVVLNDEKVNMVLTGLVRENDISAENTVISTKISDAHIYYETSGEVSRTARPGFLWTVFQFINPF